MCFQRVYCLYVRGISLNEPALRLLMLGACQMSQQEKREHVVKIQGGEAVLTTRYETGLMGHVAGIEFTADIGIGSRQAQVSFLVREADLKRITTFAHTQNYCLVEQMREPHKYN